LQLGGDEYYETTTNNSMMWQIALQTAFYYRVNNMTKPRFTDIERTDLTVRQIMEASASSNGRVLTDYTIVIEAVGGSSGPETITSPSNVSVENAMKRLHANSSVDGVVSLRIKHSQDKYKDRYLAIVVETSTNGVVTMFKNSFVGIKVPKVDGNQNFNYDPSRHNVREIYTTTYNGINKNNN